jgi:hypothetical protein
MPISFVFKSISKDSIPDALKKAERYRLLGDPEEAESVCLDILEADPGNQDALVDLVLAISDQFRNEKKPRLELAQEYVAQLTDEYHRTYYTAVVMEREAGAILHSGTPPVWPCCATPRRWTSTPGPRPSGPGRRLRHPPLERLCPSHPPPAAQAWDRRGGVRQTGRRGLRLCRSA